MTETGFAYDLKHMAEHFLHNDRKQGKRNDAALAIVGGAMVFIGASFMLDAAKSTWKDRAKQASSPHSR